MPRWEPGSMERMQMAAIELFAEQGFEKTTVNEIAERAGVTRRTFFRHFSDKREVLFSGSVTDLPQAALVEGIARADGDLMPVQVVASAIAGYDWDALSPRPLQRKRHAVIMANQELMERELVKYEAIALALSETLRQRGTDAGAARLAAHVGIAIFRSAYDRWLETSEETGMGQVIEDVVTTLRTAIGADASGQFPVS